MKATTVATAALLASHAAAVPSSLAEKLRSRRRQYVADVDDVHVNSWSSGNPLRVNYEHMGERIVVGNSTGSAVSYDSNWAGGVVTTSGVTSVTGTWTVPMVSEGSGGGNSGAAIWVGIDGDSCQQAILQTGIAMTLQNGHPSYSGWYEWFPQQSIGYNNFAVTAGDEIRASVLATSAVSGETKLENLSTGQTVTKQFTNMGSVGKLCMQDAEWIVEDFEEGGGLVDFADFGSVTISDASYVASGNTMTASGASILDIQDSQGNIDTNCSAQGDVVMCTYTGST